MGKISKCFEIDGLADLCIGLIFFSVFLVVLAIINWVISLILTPLFIGAMMAIFILIWVYDVVTDEPTKDGNASYKIG